MSTFAVDQNGFVHDTTRYLSPRMRIVPDDHPVLRDQNMCGICWGFFNETADPDAPRCLGGGPRILTCSHVFGRDCFISSMLVSANHSCPICRRVFPLRIVGQLLTTRMHTNIKRKITELDRLAYPLFSRKGLLLFKFVLLVLLTPTYDFVELTMNVAMRDRIRGPFWLWIYKGFKWMSAQTFRIVLFGTLAPPITLFSVLFWLLTEIPRIPNLLGYLISLITNGLMSVILWAGPWPILGFMFPPGAFGRRGLVQSFELILTIGLTLEMTNLSWSDLLGNLSPETPEPESESESEPEPEME
ncbi:hypothetical protein VTL71DRAFT_1292 [Oculimacula yallundae]|uniref:RING-type domain-containing protein n=1 Tax=Oculimacula yallundae TaxID=86028 RepID=A0ABR4CA94_9HELO